MEQRPERRPFGEVRRKALYSIKALAKESGASSRTIVDLEHGRRAPRLATIRKLSNVLGVDPMTVIEFAAVIEGETDTKTRGE